MLTTVLERTAKKPFIENVGEEGLESGSTTNPFPNRSRFVQSAANDPVSDYRLVANMPMWHKTPTNEPLITEASRVLDVCCGHGRFLQALTDMAGPAPARMDFVDLCADSLAILRQRRARLQTEGRLSPGSVWQADACELPEDQVAAYDVVTNIHGLYGFHGGASNNPNVTAAASSSPLHTVLQRMLKSLRPAGTLVIAISTRDTTLRPAFYSRVGHELADIGVTEAPYVCAEDVEQVLAGMGIVGGRTNQGYEMSWCTVKYLHTIKAHNRAEVRHYVLSESGANSFPTTFTARDGSMTQKDLSTHLMALAEKHYLHKNDGVFNFPQCVGIFTIRRDA